VKRWEVFRSPIRTEVATTIKIVEAACTLHNYLMTKCQTDYSVQFDANNQSEELQDEGILLPLSAATGKNADNSAKMNRDIFCDYFNGEGAITWQNNYL
jgi:hypothetical protein